MFKRLVLGMVSLCACAMPRGHSSGGKLRAGSPYHGAVRLLSAPCRPTRTADMLPGGVRGDC
jgi:hypothetical protein